MKTLLPALALSILFFGNFEAHAIVFNMAPLEFSNRAVCADLSTKPARSAFLMIDGFNAGKAGFVQGLLAQKQNPSEVPGDWAKKAVTQFRLWSTHLSVDLLEALLQGKLPLLPVDATYPAIYKQAVESCLNKEQLLNCPAMNDLLSEIWSRSRMENPNWSELGFTAADFFPQPLAQNAAIGCHIVRKYSAFHSPLKSQTVDQGIVNNIGIDSFHPENTLASCFNAVDTEDPRFTTVQLDLANLPDERAWNEHLGFRFWHTYKLLLSWGWRYAPQVQVEFGQFRQTFPSIAFEDSVMLVPNGCRSIEIPKCDSAGLASDAMRAAKYLGTTHVAVSEVPAKPIDVLFQGKLQGVNDDQLGLYKAENADLWYRDFKDKLSALRFQLLTSINTSLAKLQIIDFLLTPETLMRDIEALLKDPNVDKNETYLACLEFTLARNQLFEDIYQEILTLKDARELDSVLMADSGRNLETYINTFKKLSDGMTPFCKSLETEGKLTNSNPDIFKSLNEWAFNILRPIDRAKYDGQCIKNPDHPACPQIKNKRYLMSGQRLTAGDTEFPICHTPLECARTVLHSLVSVVSVRRYARAFLPMSDVLSTPALFNTYRMPTACKLYDPWYKKRSTWKLFVADLGSALLSGASCGAFNFRMIDPAGKKVVAYQELYKENENYYEPVIRKLPTRYMAGLNLQFLSGLSCSIAGGNLIMSGRALTSHDFFANLVVSVCDGSASTVYTVSKEARLDPTLNTAININQKIQQTCFSCAVSAKNLVNSACLTTPGIGQVVSAGVGIFQGIMRLFANLRDPDNMPHGTVMNIDQIAQSFETHGKITKRCHNRLKKGISCDGKENGQP